MSVRRFLQSAVDQAATYLQVLDGDSRQPETDNPVLKEAAQLALAQARTYTKRQLVYGNYCERYENVGSDVPLKEQPIDAITEVKIVRPGDPSGDVILVENTDYVLDTDFGSIRFLDTLTLDSFLTGLDDFNEEVFRVVQVKYTGGWKLAKNNDNLLAALTQQTSANYRRAPVVGLSTITGGSQTGSITTQNASDKGGLTDSAASMLDSLTYEGQAIAC